MMPHLHRLINGVGRRHVIASFGERWRFAWFGASAVALVLIVFVRLFALLPANVLMPALFALSVIPLVIALTAIRRPPPRQVARLIDERSTGKELFLTASLISNVTGEFRSVVLEQAEQQSIGIDPARIVPFRWRRGVCDAIVAIVIVSVAMWSLPQLDPFNREANRKRISQQEQRLVESNKATEVRREQIAQQEGRETEQVRQALADLEKIFKEVKPRAREENLKQLGDQQEELGSLWKRVNSDKVRNPIENIAQNLGPMAPKKLEQWREQMKQGEVADLKKEYQEIRQQLSKLADRPESLETKAAREQLAQRLNELTQGIKQLANSSPAVQALQRAIEQMDLSKLGAISKEAMEAAMDSLNLSEKELEHLAQSLKDANALEDALKNLQMAKQLADKDALDGQECKNCNGMGDYAKLFAAKCNAMGLGERVDANASGMGPGIGNGARRPEDDNAKTAFKQENSKAPIAGGKMLLEWKTKEVGETGARIVEYRDAIVQVKQGAAEAIQQEQVPPGYHDAIKRYFDTLPQR